MEHRDLQPSTTKNSGARGGGSPGRLTSKEQPMPVEPTLDQLRDARERMDAGLRLAFPELVGRTFDVEVDVEETAAPDPAIDPATVDQVALSLLEARRQVMEAGAELPLAGCIDLHLRFNALVNELDAISTVLAERRGS